MDRHAKKMEKKRRSRAVARKKAQAATAHRASTLTRLLASAASRPFGPCWVSAGWDDMSFPQLVTGVVTRELPNGLLLPGTALIDRTCLGIKNGFAREPLDSHEMSEFLDRAGDAHGGMEPCDPLVLQSIVFHAVAYARSLGFEPHRDFPEELFGPAPEVLLETPFCTSEHPMYVPGPHDNLGRILGRLDATAGSGNYLVTGTAELLATKG